MEARKLKTLGFKYIWSRNGRIFVKATDVSTAIKLDNMDHLKLVEARLLEKKHHTSKRRNISASTNQGSPNDVLKDLEFCSPEKKRGNFDESTNQEEILDEDLHMEDS